MELTEAVSTGSASRSCSGLKVALILLVATAVSLTVAAGDNRSGRNSEESATIRSTALVFFAGLRSPDRADVRAALTEEARRQTGGERSPLTLLPSPAPGSASIRAGRVEIADGIAEIPVRVKAGGRYHKTKLHLREEDEAWRVFAISAVYPDGEKSIDFEAEFVPESQRSENGAIGKPMPLAGFSLDGRPLDMSQFAGKVVLVDFWATWCGPCRAEIPNMRRVWDQYHDQGFEIIAISVDRDLDTLRDFVAEEQPPWTVVADNHPRNDTRMSARYGVSGIPMFVLLDGEGKIADINCRREKLGPAVAKALQSSSSNL